MTFNSNYMCPNCMEGKSHKMLDYNTKLQRAECNRCGYYSTSSPASYSTQS